MALPAILGAAAGALLPVVGDLMNMKNVDRTNDTNKTIQDSVNSQELSIFNEQMDYAKSLQQQTWAREDTAYQRAVQDARRAGFSPLVAQGINAGGAGAVVSQPSPPALNAARMQAPQMGDLNGMTMVMDMALKQKELSLADRKLDIEETRIDKDVGERKASRLQDQKQFETQIETMQNQLTLRMAQEKDLADRRILQDIFEFNESLRVREEARSFDETLRSEELVLRKSEHLMSRAYGQTSGRSSNYRAYDNWDEYTVAKRQWMSEYEQFIMVALAEPTTSSTSNSRGGNGSLSVAGTGLGLGANVSGSSSRSIALKQEQLITRWFASHPVPVFYSYKRSH